MAKKPLPTPEELRQLLSYDPKTGKLYWLERPEHYFDTQRTATIWNRRYPGKPALNCADRYGYAHGQLFDRRVYAHRVIWALLKGEWPKLIDHIDGDLTNNRIENLRNVTQTTNMRNACLPSNNKSGAIGVRIMKDGRFKVCVAATFTSFDDAVDASHAARTAMGFHPMHGRRESTRQKRHHAMSAGEPDTTSIVDSRGASAT